MIKTKRRAGPLCLQPFPKPGDVTYQFTTFGPQDLGGTSSQYPVVTRPAVIGKYAYTGEFINTAISGLGIFDITDPSSPVDLGTGATFVGRATDVAGQEQSPVTGGALVAVSAGMVPNQDVPANVWLYDVSSPTKPNRVGAVSVSADATSGIALRLFLKGQFLYAATFLQGLQVIDLSQAIPEYQQVFSTNPSQFGQSVTTAGDGFAMDTIVNTIQLPITSGGTATMYDLKADDFTTTSGNTQTLLAATGQLPFVLADPTLSGSSAVLYPPAPGGQFATNPVQPLTQTSADGTTNNLFCNGRAVAFANLASDDGTGTTTTKHVAVLVGAGMTSPAASTTACPSTALPANTVPALMVVDLSDAYAQGSPFTIKPLGFLQLPTTPTDVNVNGNVALVATGSNILLVNLANPSQPILAGQITGNFGNWVTTNASGLIVGSSTSPTGVQVSSLGVVPQISVDPNGLLATSDGNTSADIPINYGISGDLSQVVSAQVQITDDTGQVVFSSPVPVQTTGLIKWPANQQIHITPNTISFQVQNPDGNSSMFAAAIPEYTSGPTPTPVILSISPSRIAIGAPEQTIDIKGRNYLSSTQALLVLSTADPTIATPANVPIQFISSTEIKIQLTQDYLAQAGTLESVPN